MKKLKFAMLSALLLALSLHEVWAGGFPRGPNLELTPGRICSRSNSNKTRYPERIAYCDRNVNYDTKENIIDMYDQKLGYSIGNMDRQEFKIDHLIPLCAGGSNDMVNLWPQHKSVYTITDPLEPIVCRKMGEGKLLQKDAVALILEAKTHLDRVRGIIEFVSAL